MGTNYLNYRPTYSYANYYRPNVFPSYSPSYSYSNYFRPYSTYGYYRPYYGYSNYGYFPRYFYGSSFISSLLGCECSLL